MVFFIILMIDDNEFKKTIDFWMVYSVFESSHKKKTKNKKNPSPTAYKTLLLKQIY